VSFRFDWDPHKAKTNFKKHGVTFDEAADVFYAPNVSVLDKRYTTNEEERWLVIGMTRDGKLLLVVCIIKQYEAADDEMIRIISARKATRNERAYYEKEIPSVS